jgi:hypothetical protein
MMSRSRHIAGPFESHDIRAVFCASKGGSETRGEVRRE